MRKKISAILLLLAGFLLLALVFAQSYGLSVLATTISTVGLILITSSFISYRSGLNLGYTLMVTAIPLSCCEVLTGLVLSLQMMSGKDGLYHLSDVLMILTAGAVLSSIGYFCSPKNLNNLKIKLLNWYDILTVLLALSIWFFLEMSSAEYGIGPFIDPSSILITAAFVAFSTGGALLIDRKVSTSLTDGSVATVLFGIVFCAAYYFTALQDMRAIGPLLAVGLLTSLYGIILYYFSFLYSLKEGTIQQQNFTTKNWHVIEGLGFLIFLVFGPPTIWETF
tara:strand:- start:810 stop:1649 length:840 start_codon:yes stop_codon:yes gene_type:complete